MNNRVLIVSNLFPPNPIGGAEIVADRQARALSRAGCNVTVLAGRSHHPVVGNGEMDVEEVDGLLVYRLSLKSLDTDSNFHWDAAGRRLISVLATCKPDVVHFHNCVGLGANLISVAKRFGAKVVVTLHDHWGVCFKNTMLRDDMRVCTDAEDCALCKPSIASPDEALALPIRLRRDYVAWCLSQADLLLSPSEFLADSYRRSGVLARDVRPRSNGIDLDVIPVSMPRQEGRVEFVCFSYLGEHKGILSLLDAAAILATDERLRGCWHLTIAGHGHLSEALNLQIAKGRFGDSMTFVGRLAHREALGRLAVSDVVILPSIWPENEPVTLLEAIAAGKAQLATRIGGNSALVDHELSGLLVEPGNADDLAQAMRRFVEDADLACRFGAYNAARRDRFDEKLSIGALLEAYRQPVAHLAEECVVICAGASVPPNLDLLLHRFHLVEALRPRVRFVWHEWADAHLWQKSKLLWLWGESNMPGGLEIVRRALRQGVPVLAPEPSDLSELAARPDGIGCYSTLLEAVGIIAALQECGVHDERHRRSAPASARLLSGLSPRSSFELRLNADP